MPDLFQLRRKQQNTPKTFLTRQAQHKLSSSEHVPAKKQTELKLEELTESYLDKIEQDPSIPAKSKRSHHIIIKSKDVNKVFNTKLREVKALDAINLNIYSGEFVVIYGPSGCGKSTLLHTLIGLEPPTYGQVTIRDTDIYALNENDRARFRREKLGMVFQQSNWIKSFSVAENVAYPLFLTGASTTAATAKAVETLEKIGMDYVRNARPYELSGGEQQRVALARALVTDPWIIVADEPTGNLDSNTTVEIMKVLVKLNRIENKTVIMVTHEMGLLELATRKIGLLDGKVVADEHFKAQKTK